MIKSLCLFSAIVFLAGCQQDQAALPEPVDITAESAGFYCQMALLEHDGPKGQIHLEGLAAPLFFSQVKDAVAYLHMPEQSHAVVTTYVQDMSIGTWDAPGPWVNVAEAVYVIGSDRMGGMGAPEFVPFSSIEAAQIFADHHGGKVRAYETITASEALSVPQIQSPPASSPDDDISARLGALTQNKGN
ncbi:MAG: nitrous oxide reductase accessory protein NosL [Pseudoruegeria sp.]